MKCNICVTCVKYVYVSVWLPWWLRCMSIYVYVYLYKIYICITCICVRYKRYVLCVCICIRIYLVKWHVYLIKQCD